LAVYHAFSKRDVRCELDDPAELRFSDSFDVPIEGGASLNGCILYLSCHLGVDISHDRIIRWKI
jgi:hypothetical protein